MEHAGDLREFPDHRHAVLMGFPFVDDYRQVQFPGQGHLIPEGPELNLPGDILVVVVQADLPDGLHLGILFT